MALSLARVFFLAGLLCAPGCGSEALPQSAPQQDSLEYKLATVDHGSYVAQDDVTVARFRSLLAQLSSKYAETPKRIADISVKARDTLRGKGISESILNIMEGMNQVLEGPILSSSGR
jgi:hypothetical protein